MGIGKLKKKKAKALADGNQLALASACIDLAGMYNKEGQFQLAIEEYSNVAKCYKKLNKTLDYARVNRMIGETYMQLGEFDKALEYHHTYLNISRSENDKLEEQRALASVGHTYLTRYLDAPDNPNDEFLTFALKAFKKSLQVCQGLTGISKLEHLDMTARLLANLGVIHDSMHNYSEGISLLERSIAICKENDLYEQLERSYTALAALYTRKQEYNNAIHNYNQAMEVASRLPNKVELLCSSLIAKADLLIRLADFRAAKNLLLKAHKLKTPNLVERTNITNTLKTVAAMCYSEDSIMVASDDDHERKKQLYEKLGDGACHLQNYAKGIEYYQKMLQEAQMKGDTGKDLAICYFSLAQTYKDNNQYDLALSYSEKELKLWKDDLKKSVQIYFNNIDIMECAGKDPEEIATVYLQILKMCADNTHLKGKILKHYKEFLQKHDKLEQLQRITQEFEGINCVSSDSEPEATDEDAASNIGDDIDINQITDISDTSDIEEVSSKPRARKQFIVKKNNKGETQLHTACIKGNVELVRRLLDQGHPVNVRDNCGWLPLHEACSWGHLAIVKLLVKKGASVNDHGGKLCDGITPLHDAAVNGHLAVVEYLLNNGASPLAKNNQGETALHALKKWRTNTMLDQNELISYSSLVERMTTYLQKAGHSVNTVPVQTSVSSSALISSPKEKSPNKQSTTGTFDKNVKVGSARKTLETNDDMFCNNTSQKSNGSAETEYKQVMNSLRRRSEIKISGNERKRKSNETKTPALVEVDVDDWLEDDIGKLNKKRKTSADDLIYKSNVKNTSYSVKQRRSWDCLTDRNSRAEQENCCDSDFDLDEIENVPINVNLSDDDFLSDSSRSSGSHKRKKQLSLIAAGFSRNCTSPSKSNIVSKNVHNGNKSIQKKLTHFVQPSEIIENSGSPQANKKSSTVVDPPSQAFFSVDIRIEGKLYRVPVTLNDLNVRNIKWLAEEASKRYAKREGIKPVLELETKNGAFLADDDLVSMLFAGGNHSAEELQAKIIKQNLPPLAERYEEACSHFNTVPDDQMKLLLHKVSACLNLSEFVFRSPKLSPLCKALARQTNLCEINLSGNLMTDDCMQLLCTSLSFLKNLSKLDLSLNHLSWEGVKYLADTLTEHGATILEHLVHLDLSYNSLGNESLKYIANITKFLKLRFLGLGSIDWNNHIFDYMCNESVSLHLSQLESINISGNSLNRPQIKRVIAWLNPSCIKAINISWNKITESGILHDIINVLQGPETINITKLELANCQIDDSDVMALMGLFYKSEKFTYVDLSHNLVSGTTLQKLLHHDKTPSQLFLHRCKHVLDGFEIDRRINTPEVLTIYYRNGEHQNEFEQLCATWKELHKDDGKVEEVLKESWKFSYVPDPT